jgi:hypothetical protein
LVAQVSAGKYGSALDLDGAAQYAMLASRVIGMRHQLHDCRVGETGTAGRRGSAFLISETTRSKTCF